MSVRRGPALGFGREGNRKIDLGGDLFALVLTQWSRNIGVWDCRTKIDSIARTMIVGLVVAVET